MNERAIFQINIQLQKSVNKICDKTQDTWKQNSMFFLRKIKIINKI